MNQAFFRLVKARPFPPRLEPARAACYEAPSGWVAERLKAAVLKTARGSRPSWVRIPPHPPPQTYRNSAVSGSRVFDGAGEAALQPGRCGGTGLTDAGVAPNGEISWLRNRSGIGSGMP